MYKLCIRNACRWWLCFSEEFSLCVRFLQPKLNFFVNLHSVSILYYAITFGCCVCNRELFSHLIAESVGGAASDDDTTDTHRSDSLSQQKIPESKKSTRRKPTRSSASHTSASKLFLCPYCDLTAYNLGMSLLVCQFTCSQPVVGGSKCDLDLVIMTDERCMYEASSHNYWMYFGAS